MHRNKFETRLGRYLPLAPAEREALRAVQGEERRLAPGDQLLTQGEAAGSLFVLQFGWMHASVMLQQGVRQILRFHYAGDLIGTSSIAWSRASDTVTAIGDCVLRELPKPALGRLFVDQPRIGGVLYALAAAEAVAASDRLTAMGRMDAVDRLSFLFLDIIARLRVTAGGVQDSFDLPLTQADLADALGLTKVHVNRTLRAMEQRGIIERSGRRIRLLDEAELAGRLRFVDRYSVVETDWLPQAA